MLKQTQPQVYGLRSPPGSPKNKNGLSIAAKALLGLCLVGVVICLGASGKNGISSVKGWLIAIGVAAALLVFGDAFLDSIYVA